MLRLDENHFYVNALFTFKPGDQIMLTVMRNNQDVQVQIMLGESKHN